MKKAIYQAVFEPNGSGGYGVYFPDLPGCVSFGDSASDAQKNAADALGLHLYGMEKDGDPIPAPSPTVEIDPDTASGFFVSPITVFPDLVRNELDTRRVKTNVTLPAWLKEEAEQQNVNFSRLLEAALADYLRLPT